MAVETDADRATFFDTDDFGVPALWTLAAGGAPWSVNVIMDRPHELVDVGEQEIALERPRATCRAADLPIGYGKLDTFEIGLDIWTVERVDLDMDREIATVILRT
jgi:hypothetical protein